MVWKDCGYLSLTKDCKKVSVVVKHTRYVANLDELKAVLEGKQGYALILEPQGETHEEKKVQ
jgi:hypothetical protein